MKVLNLVECVKCFNDTFPEHELVYKEHLIDYGEIIGHVFFGDVINIPFTQLLSKNDNIDAIRKYADFINLMFDKGDEAVKNIVMVTILEYVGDIESNLQTAFLYFSQDVKDASYRVESFLGRGGSWMWDYISHE